MTPLFIHCISTAV